MLNRVQATLGSWLSAAAALLLVAYAQGAWGSEQSIFCDENKELGGSIPRFPVLRNRAYKPFVVVAPDYPTQAREDGVEGTVVVRFDIGRSGKVSNVEVERSDSEVLDMPTLNAVEMWVFTQNVVDCEPVDVKGVTAVVEFRDGVVSIFLGEREGNP